MNSAVGGGIGFFRCSGCIETTDGRENLDEIPGFSRKGYEKQAGQEKRAVGKGHFFSLKIGS